MNSNLKINHVKLRLLLMALLVLLALTLTGLNSIMRAAASTTPLYAVSWSTIDGGGALHAPGEGYTLSATTGQPDAGNVQGGEGYSLTGGFWTAFKEKVYKCVFPLVFSN